MPTSPQTLLARDTERRHALIAAARACFLQHGFEKTSLEDVAQRAGLARPLIYRKFKNKEELLGAIFEADLAGRSEAAEQVASGRGGKREKLLRLCELLFVEPWAEIAAAPMAAEFLEGAHLGSEITAQREKARHKQVQAILGSKDLTEVFLLAAHGLHKDRPAAKVLKRRFEVLAGQFAG
jgi:AcrR family transcriptional regulator